MLALGLGDWLSLGQGLMEMGRKMGGVGWGMQADKVPVQVIHGCRSLLRNLRTKWDPKLMTFRCTGLAIWSRGNHTEAKATAPGLPKQTPRPRVNPPEPGAWGLPPDFPAPRAGRSHTCPL